MQIRAIQKYVFFFYVSSDSCNKEKRKKIKTWILNFFLNYHFETRARLLVVHCKIQIIMASFIALI
jgi:hypothetical protein